MRIPKDQLELFIGKPVYCWRIGGNGTLVYYDGMAAAVEQPSTGKTYGVLPHGVEYPIGKKGARYGPPRSPQ